MGSRQRMRRARSLASVALVGGGIALLLWAKLRLVTQVPRAAYADPESEPRPDSNPSRDGIDAESETQAMPEPQREQAPGPGRP